MPLIVFTDQHLQSTFPSPLLSLKNGNSQGLCLSKHSYMKKRDEVMGIQMFCGFRGFLTQTLHMTEGKRYLVIPLHL